MRVAHRYPLAHSVKVGTNPVDNAWLGGTEKRSDPVDDAWLGGTEKRSVADEA